MKNNFFGALVIGTFLGVAMPAIGMEQQQDKFFISKPEMKVAIVPNVGKKTTLMHDDEIEILKKNYPNLANIRNVPQTMIPLSICYQQLSKQLDTHCYSIPLAWVLSDETKYKFVLNNVFEAGDYEECEYSPSAEERVTLRMLVVNKVLADHEFDRNEEKKRFDAELINRNNFYLQLSAEKDREIIDLNHEFVDLNKFLQDIAPSDTVVETVGNFQIKNGLIREIYEKIFELSLARTKNLQSIREAKDAEYKPVITGLEAKISLLNETLQTMYKRGSEKSQKIDELHQEALHDVKIAFNTKRAVTFYKRALWFTFFVALAYILKMHYAVAH